MVKTICVCGAGTMGSGIAQVSAQSGFHTILFDVNEQVLERSRLSIESALQSLVNKGKIADNDREAILQRLQFTTNLNDCIADVIIEAIVEKLEAKVSLLNQLFYINSNDTVYATNTSSLSVSAIAAKLAHPQRLSGMHFFNPATLMKLVEVVKGEQTSKGAFDTIYCVAGWFGKTRVICKDAPGFIVNRVARHYYLEAMRLVEAGLADIETVDAVMEATGFKMGPFKLMDLIGMDINYGVSNIVWEALGRPERLQPSTFQKQKVDAGELGKKTGKGFYSYQ